MLHDLLPDARHLLQLLQLLSRDHKNHAFARGTLHTDGVLRIAKDAVLEAR